MLVLVKRVSVRTNKFTIYPIKHVFKTETPPTVKCIR